MIQSKNGKTSERPDVDVRAVGNSSKGQLFDLFAAIVASGEGYPQLPPLSQPDFEASWVKVTVVIGAFVGDELAGAYYLKPNFPGRGSHIANAGYVVDSKFRGRGIGRLLVEDSITRAPSAGFDAIQFNFVFAGNPARPLYEKLGWREIGRIPNAVQGDDAVIYWRAVP
jgi:GNAT superfamily N-acetyltransferase